MLAFEVGGRRGAIPAGDVREIVRMVQVAPLPGAPVGVDGAITVRGAAVPVVDLGNALGLAPRPVDPDEHLILVDVAGRLAALRVDRALELRTIDESRLEEQGPAAPGVAWVPAQAEPLVLLADLAAFLGGRVP